jgi:hypothetical protein
MRFRLSKALRVRLSSGLLHSCESKGQRCLICSMSSARCADRRPPVNIRSFERWLCAGSSQRQLQHCTWLRRPLAAPSWGTVLAMWKLRPACGRVLQYCGKVTSRNVRRTPCKGHLSVLLVVHICNNNRLLGAEKAFLLCIATSPITRLSYYPT